MNLFSALNPNLEKQIAATSRAVDDARRIAHRDSSRLGELVEHMNALAELRQQEGNFAKAESLYREALARIHEVKTPDPQLVVGVYSLLAYLYDRWGKLKEAADFYRKALALGQQHGIHASDEVATVKNNLAMIHKGMKEHDLAAQYYEEALEEFRQIHGEQCAEVASVCNNLGVLHYQNMDLDRAHDMHLRALRIRESLNDQGGPQAAGDLAQTLINLGAVHKALGDFQQAQECIEKARAISSGQRHTPVPLMRRSAELQLDASA